MRTSSWTTFAALVLTAAACSAPEAGDQTAGETGDDMAGEMPARAVTAPDTTAVALWSHMQAQDYRTNWALWPGLDPFYGGNEPHGLLLTTYVNDVALQALQAGQTVMPADAIIIKENYTPERELVATTVMYKVPGYNEAHADWFFVKYRPDGTVDQAPNGMALEGRVPGCQSCHQNRADFDYLYSPRPGSQGQ